MSDVKEIIQKKDGRNYTTVDTITDPERVYKDLALDLINKKLARANWIRRIDRTRYPDGTQKITVYQCNIWRTVYLVDNNF